MFSAVDILVVALAVVALVGVRPMRPLGPTNDEYLSLGAGKSVRGLFALVVVFHHLALRADGLLLAPFRWLGFLAVAVFFFYSGYGLQKSFLTKPGYKNGYLLRRVPTVLFPYVAVVLLYWIFFLLVGESMTPAAVWDSFATGYPIAKNTWYVLVIIVFYVVFWLLMVVCCGRADLMIAGACLWFLVHVAVCGLLGFPNWYYMTAPLLIVGMVWATCEKRILSLFMKAPLVILVVLWGLFAAFFAENWFVGLWTAAGLPAGATLCHVITALLFGPAVILTGRYLRYGNKVLDFVGGISFELYMIHGLFIELFYVYWTPVQSDLVLCGLVLVCSIAAAIVLNKLFAKMMGAYKRALK